MITSPRLPFCGNWTGNNGSKCKWVCLWQQYSHLLSPVNLPVQDRVRESLPPEMTKRYQLPSRAVFIHLFHRPVVQMKANPSFTSSPELTLWSLVVHWDELLVYSWVDQLWSWIPKLITYLNLSAWDPEHKVTNKYTRCTYNQYCMS